MFHEQKLTHGPGMSSFGRAKGLSGFNPLLSSTWWIRQAAIIAQQQDRYGTRENGTQGFPSQPHSAPTLSGPPIFPSGTKKDLRTDWDFFYSRSLFNDKTAHGVSG
ncbi:hypothetical protein HZA87_04065 [Candidatus Uhrbacteria bacterium]|nr:hypothetical protein [Candidatus Uhrbacteria bacterium]